MKKKSSKRTSRKRIWKKNRPKVSRLCSFFPFDIWIIDIFSLEENVLFSWLSRQQHDCLDILYYGLEMFKGTNLDPDEVGQLRQLQIDLKMYKEGFWFRCPAKELQENFFISVSKERKIIKSLKEKGFIETTVKGIPPARYIRLNQDKYKEVFGRELKLRWIKNEER